MIKELIELRKQIQKVAFKFGEIVTVDGLVLVSKDEMIVDGSEVFVYDDMGALIPAPNGTYKFEDGSSIDVVDGIAKMVAEGEVETVEPIVEEVEPTEVPLKEEELVDEPIVEEEVIVEEPIVEEADPMVAVAEIISELLEKISELSNVIDGMKVQMSSQEEMIGKLAKYSKADVIVEKPELAEPNNKKMSKAERIMSAK